MQPHHGRARYDKHGRQLPDTGHGCGCRLCEAMGAPRYERRSEPHRDRPPWHPLQRSLAGLLRALADG